MSWIERPFPREGQSRKMLTPNNWSRYDVTLWGQE